MGCLCGAAIIYGNYKSAIDQFEGGPNIRTVPGYSETATAGVFNTYPQPFLTKTGQVFSEIIASTVLIFVIFALKDDNNLGAGNQTPLMLFFLIFGIGATLGWETGYAINLARDFGPRLFTYMVGYGPNVWKAGDYYFWVSVPSIRGDDSALMEKGSHDLSLYWLYLWRFPVRCPHIHRRIAHQYAMDGAEAIHSPLGDGD
jgi:aquaglyceroporin related protein